MRHIIFLLNQLGIVLLSFGFGQFGNQLSTDDGRVLLSFIGIISLGVLLIGLSLVWMIDDVVRNKILTRRYATYKFILLILCEASLSLVATGLGFLFNGDFIAGGMYLVIAFVMVMLTSSGLTLFKHIFFTFDK